jgi:predicted alpha/beta hydrolase family esterase
MRHEVHYFDSYRGLGRDALAELLVNRVPKGDSKDWDNPILADWLESLNAAIESAEEKYYRCSQSCLLANQPLVKNKIHKAGLCLSHPQM